MPACMNLSSREEGGVCVGGEEGGCLHTGQLFNG